MTPDLGNMMKQVQEMQEKMKQSQEKLGTMEVTGEAGAGLVKVTLTGHNEAKRVAIDDSLLGPDSDKEMLEDLVTAAINAAIKKVSDISQQQMGDLTGGLNMPADFKLPF